MENVKFNLDKYCDADPWQFEEEFARMEQRARMELLMAMEKVPEARRSAELLFAYCIDGVGGWKWIGFQGLPWESDLVVPAEVSLLLEMKGYIGKDRIGKDGI